MALIKRDESKSIEDVICKNLSISSIEELDKDVVYVIKYLDKAAEMIFDAIKKKKLITIVGDYDADGVTSSSIMYYVLKLLGANVKVRIPRRLSEGFGLNMNIIEEIDSGLVITVDNGIVAFEPVKRAKEKGLDVIITDHHLPDESGMLPEADLIIDPHLEDAADFADYCGAGIAYKLAQYLTNDEKVLAKLSCFAAIGTVADVMPLVEDNRKIVKEGLKNMVSYGCRTTGLYSVLRAADLDTHITAHDIAFKIGPMINACGRLFDDGAMIAFNSIVYDGAYKEEIGTELVAYNETRKQKVAEGIAAVHKNITMNCLFGDIPLVIYEPSIEEGIVGIIAGKLAEEYNVPTFVFTNSEDPNIYKGSGRTAGQVHLKDLLDSCSETLYKYGGHAEAAGVSVEKVNFDKMHDMMQDKCPELVLDEDNKNVYYDLEIKASEIVKTCKELEKYEPYGQGNPKPVFLVKDFQLSPRYSSFYKELKGDTISLYGIGCSAIGFGMAPRYHELSDPKKLLLVGTISETFFMGRGEVKLEIEDMDASNTTFTKSLLAQQLEARAKARYS